MLRYKQLSVLIIGVDHDGWEPGYNYCTSIINGLYHSRMSYDDVLSNFTNIDICHFVNTAFFTTKKSWTEFMVNGEWTLGARGTKKDRAGGNTDNVSFLFNPQVFIYPTKRCCWSMCIIFVMFVICLSTPVIIAKLYCILGSLTRVWIDIPHLDSY